MEKGAVIVCIFLLINKESHRAALLEKDYYYENYHFWGIPSVRPSALWG